MALLAQHRLGSSLPLGLSGQALSSFPVAPRQCRRNAAPRRTLAVTAKYDGAASARNGFATRPEQHTFAIRSVACAASASAAASSGDEVAESPPGFKRDRWITFFAMFIGYASFYLTRNSLAYTAPAMLKDPALGMDLAKIGGLTSILPVAYGFSKFLSGVLGARTSPVMLLAGGLVATASVNIMFGASTAYPLLLAFWGLNGLLQGLGSPACARILTSWYPDRERGTFWGFWTASNNIGGFLAPIIAGNAAAHYGWRYGMFAPGGIALAMSVIVALFMKESPEKLGYPSVGDGKPKPKAAAPAAGPHLCHMFIKAQRWGGAGGEAPKRSLWNLLYQDCVKNPYVWLFAIAYFFVYVVRQGVTSWFIFYLQDKGATNAATQVSGLELGGLFGSLSSGAISDHLVRNNDGSKGNVGLRVQVVMAYTVATAVVLAAFWACPNVAWMQWLLVAGVGFALYGPQMLIGLCGAEVVPKPSVSAANGMLGWISYLGAANAGVPLAMIVQRFGWDAFFIAMTASCAVVLLLMAPMTNLKSYSQREAEGLVKAA